MATRMTSAPRSETRLTFVHNIRKKFYERNSD